MDQNDDMFDELPPLDNPFSQHLNLPCFNDDLVLAKHHADNQRPEPITTETHQQEIQECTRPSKRRKTNHRARNSKTQAAAAIHTDVEKLKASNITATTLTIGSWKKVANNEGELVVKFYFAKRRIVWELLKNGLKEKIEIDWADITGIEAKMEENQPGFLEVELLKPPKFYNEIDPEPRKHSQWKDGSDFTDGQASTCRRHLVTFPTGVLNKHYQKLIENDDHLCELSQRPFPTVKSPFFSCRFNVPSANSPLQFGGYQRLPQQQIQIAHLSMTSSQRPVNNFTSNFNNIATHQGIQNQRVELLNQMATDQMGVGPNNFTVYGQIANYNQPNSLKFVGEMAPAGMMSSNNELLNIYDYSTGAGADPMPSSQNVAANFTVRPYQPSSSAQIEHFNGIVSNVAPIRMVDPQSSNGFSNNQIWDYPIDSNAQVYNSTTSETREEPSANDETNDWCDLDLQPFIKQMVT